MNPLTTDLGPDTYKHPCAWNISSYRSWQQHPPTTSAQRSNLVDLGDDFTSLRVKRHHTCYEKDNKIDQWLLLCWGQCSWENVDTVKTSSAGEEADVVVVRVWTVKKRYSSSFSVSVQPIFSPLSSTQHQWAKTWLPIHVLSFKTKPLFVL